MDEGAQKFPVEKVMNGPGPLIGEPVLNKEGESVKKLYATTDAKVWAEEWCKIARAVRDRDDEIIDEGWMIGWFANAFTTQEMHDQRSGPEFFHGDFEFSREEDGSLSLESAVCQALGYASMCWSKVPRGVFESEKVKDASDKLIEFIMDWSMQT